MAKKITVINGSGFVGANLSRQLSLKQQEFDGFRLPYWLGMGLGYLADIISIISGQNLPVSSISVKKFISSTEFRSAKSELEEFIPPFHLSAGIDRTLESEFI